MRNGYKVYDADTHLDPSVEVLEPFLSKRIRELAPDLDLYKMPVKTGLAGEVRQEPYRHKYRFDPNNVGWQGGAIRILGEAGPRENLERRFQKFQGTRFPTEGGQEIAEIRVKDMDVEGVDVQFMVPLGADYHDDVEVETEVIQAQHRYMDAFCRFDAQRLKSALIPSARNVKASVEEIKRWGNQPWVVGIQPYLPKGFPIDHPDLDPIWAAACDYNLPIVHHSFTNGYPGYRDLWDNPFIGRTAAHPWGAMRALAAVCGSGMMERFPTLKFGVLESGFGWLPFWARRMDDQCDYIGYVSESMKQKPSAYLTSGRFFCSIVMHEGPDMIDLVNRYMGDGILMWASDYPHSESRFPDTVDQFLGWESVPESSVPKLLWDNAVRFFGEP